jgi:hypothetical protein
MQQNDNLINMSFRMFDLAFTFETVGHKFAMESL